MRTDLRWTRGVDPLTTVVFLAVALAVASPLACRSGTPAGPEPIRHGEDVCAHCGMTIARPGFAGELRDAGGAVRKYDDLGCLFAAMITKPLQGTETWVEDHDGGALIPLRTATLARGEGDTPMGSGLVAFSDAAAARAYAQAHAGQIVTPAEIFADPRLVIPDYQPPPPR